MSVLISRDIVREPLYVVVPVSNPWRWRSRYKHAHRALKHFHDSGAVVVLVEVAFNRREFALEDIGKAMHGQPANCGILGQDHRFRHHYVQLRSSSELWLKENSINVAISRALPHDWQQVAWIDGDVTFLRPNWVGECIQKLQHYDFVQPFSHARDLGPNYEMLPEDYPHANGVGFAQSFYDGDLWDNLNFGKSRTIPGVDPNKIKQDLATINTDLSKLVSDFLQLEADIEGNYYCVTAGGRRVFPGLAWACTRQAFDALGGLLDIAIWGGGDYHQAFALFNRREGMMHTGLHPNYKAIVNAWADKCEKHVRRNVGFVKGSICHHWHGRKTSRGYGDKHRILARVGFDPLTHLKRDHQGLFQLHDDGSDSFELRDEMRRIAMERSEDGLETGLEQSSNKH
jgi:hypothetical protein